MSSIIHNIQIPAIVSSVQTERKKSFVSKCELYIHVYTKATGKNCILMIYIYIYIFIESLFYHMFQV